MASTSEPRAFNLQQWIARNAHLLKPPVSNKLVFENTGMVVQIIGGPNQRVDFHDDPVEEFFYQLKGDMVLKIAEGGRILDVPIREGEVFLAAPHLRHSPQRPMPGSVGLVVEGTRQQDVRDGFEWFCFSCGHCVHRVEIEVHDIVKDLPPLFEQFYVNEKQRTCSNCGALHPGKEPPSGWVSL
jgi:3-hydroxyanthranilate 3,4-dioxygenase